jgi:YD repeat-containing protein
LDDLSSVKNAWQKTYTYEYDDLHNLTKAAWPDKTFIAVKYDKKNDWVTSFTDRDKCTEAYKYEFSQADPQNHYWSTVKKVCGKETVADNKYEFWHKQRADGQFFLQRVMTTVNGNVTDISYHELFGKPTSIRRNAERISYEYYTDGLVKVKATPATRMAFEYDPTIKKVSQVSTTFFNQKGQKVTTKATQFKYDAKGNLNYAQNTDGQKISMTYDNRGRISTITDQAKKVVKIEYEERYGKPAIVTRPGLGTIQVSYKSNGEINKVDSKEGPSVAMQVASTFNNLLDIIAPATAELYL